MKLTDFEIGTKFYTVTGQYWLCTDVGKRTIVAIELDQKLDKNWFNGPPYALKEIVFNEKEISRCFRTEIEDNENILKRNNKNHPGYSIDVSFEMLTLRAQCLDYPRKELFQIDRVDKTGEIYHPFAAELENDEWAILVYLPYIKEFRRVKESVFIGFSICLEEDLYKRKHKIM